MSSYTLIASVSFQHEYYVQGIGGALIPEATIDTEKIFKDHRLRVKTKASGIEIHAPLDGDKLLLPLAKGLNFSWNLRANNPFFHTVTAFAPKEKSKQYLICNDINQIELAASYASYGGLSLDNVPIEGSLGSTSLSLTIQQRRQQVFGQLRIRLPKAHKLRSDHPLLFQLGLKAKKDSWQYILITSASQSISIDNTDEWRLFSTLNNGQSHTFEFAANVIELTDQVGPTETYLIANQAWSRLKPNIQFNSEKVYFVHTTQAIPFQEKPITNLIVQRKKTPSTWENVISQLRSPSPKDSGLAINRNPSIIKP